MRVTFILSILLLLLAACGTPRRGEPFGRVQLSAQAREGEGHFMRHCHQCHPGGEGGIGPALNNKPLPGFMIRLQVRRGFGYMPAFPTEEIAAQELDSVVTYMKDLRKEEKPR